MLEASVTSHTAKGNPLHSSFLKKVLLHSGDHKSDIERRDRERRFLAETIKDLRKGRMVCYTVKQGEREAGIVALSVGRIGDHPALLIDYLFVSHPFRETTQKQTRTDQEILRPTVAELLLATAHKAASEIQKLAGLTHLALKPDNEELSKMYQKRYGFKPLPRTKTEWLFMPVGS